MSKKAATKHKRGRAMEPSNGFSLDNPNTNKKNQKKSLFNYKFLTIGISVFLCGTLGAYLITQSNAAPGNSGMNTYKGQEAISKLGAKLPEVAKQNSVAPDKLKQLFLTDSTLEIDDQYNLLYTETEIPELIEGSAIIEDASAFNINPPLADAFSLNSIPGANLTIFLDFDGQTLTGTAWNSLYSLPTITAPPFSSDTDPTTFSDAERQVIIGVWAQVANDFAPYNVNVTTQDPGYDSINRSSSTDMVYGTRALISPETVTQAVCGCAGRAYVSVVNRTSNHDYYQPAWIYPQTLSNNSKYIAEAVSHEVGHNLGLGHDGTATASYYGGSGGWGPIMGSPYGQAVTHFNNGDYANANNQQDDNAIITTVLGVLADDVGDDMSAAVQLSVVQGTIEQSGLISTKSDKDIYHFNANGNVAIKVTAWGPLGYTRSNLDPKIRLYSGDGILVTETDNTFEITNIANSLSATINANLPNGKYYLEIDGVGVENLFSDYGSLGYYNITGNISSEGTSINNPPVVQASATPLAGEVPLSVAFSSVGTYDPDNTTLSYLWNFGDGSTSTSPSPTYRYITSGLYNATLTATDSTGAFSSKTIAINATPDKTAPTSPTNLQAQLNTVNAINLSWGASTDALGVKEYQLFRNGVLLSRSTALSFIDDNVIAGTTYSYNVKAIDNVGNVSVASNTVSLTIPLPTDTTPPTAPSDVTASAIGSNRIDINWKASTDNVGVTTYYIIRNGITIATVQGTVSLVYSDVNVQPSTTYSYTIKAGDAAGNVSVSSLGVSVTTPSLPDTLAPSAPTSLSGQASSTSQINLTWQASTDNVGIVGYEIYRNNNLVATVVSTSFGDSGLVSSTTYSYFVKAKDAAGNLSANSNQVSVTTNAVVTANTGVIAGKVSNSTNLSPVSGATVTTIVNGSRIRVKTDSTGSYRITGLSSGTYDLTVTFKGYNTQVVSASVVGGSTTTLNISLVSKR